MTTPSSLPPFPAHTKTTTRKILDSKRAIVTHAPSTHHPPPSHINKINPFLLPTCSNPKTYPCILSMHLPTYTHTYPHLTQARARTRTRTHYTQVTLLGAFEPAPVEALPLNRRIHPCQVNRDREKQEGLEHRRRPPSCTHRVCEECDSRNHGCR
ncbi:hypothetical protein CC80DRAFT_244653 [Byssothecium circinans]|uniref:Uncharacterized protein n=1 Tax=Byssothecium circinans TaxID=147558 RepID=A0A6A5TBL0_9PLEO|nr:hypothetical protein CC80DRAFT_244653 [Byssothecium circinans]